jgi:hypothetical protein
MDAANEPKTTGVVPYCVNGVQIGAKLYVIWGRYSVGTGTLHLAATTFNMATGTYGATDTAGPDTQVGASNPIGAYTDDNCNVNAAARPDGKISIAYCTNPVATPVVEYVVWDPGGGGWTGHQTLATDSGGFVQCYVPYGIYIDSTGRKYVIMLFFNTGTSVGQIQCVTLNNADAITSTTVVSSDVFINTFPNGLISAFLGGGYLDATNSRIVTTRMSASGVLGFSSASFADNPVWTSVNSTISIVDNSNFPVSAQGYEATSITEFQSMTVYPAGGTTLGFFTFTFNPASPMGSSLWNVIQTTYNGTSWSAPVTQVSNVGVGPGVTVANGVSALVSGTTTYIIFGIYGPNISYSSAFASIAAPAPTATSSNGPGRGAARSITLNAADLCLARDFRLLDLIDPQALSCGRRPDCVVFQDFYDGDQDGRIDHLPIPPGARRFFYTNSIPVPTVASGNNAVISFNAPVGYDGFILGHYHLYSGPGTFVEGSGDLVWRIRLNQIYARNLGNIQVTMGSPRTLMVVEGGIWIGSDQSIQYQVEFFNLTGLITPGVGNILCGLYGYFYPRT